MPSEILKIFESVQSPRVERTEKGIYLRGVKILGSESPSHRRRYTKKAMQEASSMYPGKTVRANHWKGQEVPPIEANIGIVEKSYLNDAGVFGDVLLNPNNNLAEQVAWQAENSPGSLGMSHQATGAGVFQGTIYNIDTIGEIKSVDIVSIPSTTKNLFESENPMTLEELKTNHPEIFNAAKAEGKLEAENASDPLLTESQKQLDVQVALNESLKLKVASLTSDYATSEVELQTLKESASKSEAKAGLVTLLESKGLEATDKLVDSMLVLEESARTELIESIATKPKRGVKQLAQDGGGGESVKTDSVEKEFSSAW